MIFFGERSLYLAIRECVAHYHGGRAQQGLGNERIESMPSATGECVRCAERLGGILKHYQRAAWHGWESRLDPT